MIFLTVGTQFGFDRLVQAVDSVLEDGLIDEEVYGQIGTASYQPKNFPYTDFINSEEFARCVKNCSGIISHAGIGSIMMALDNHKPLLVMPRLHRYHEVVNDHQVDICEKFESLGHLLVAYDAQDLREKIKHLKSFVPKERHNQADTVVNRIRVFLSQLAEQRKIRRL
jgi:UDP-N-acetylglucosamine transferase subunit ALG13